ncbi:hypothetical protein JCM8547_004650 [Rhodosporidiobolus lusitaniae]
MSSATSRTGSTAHDHDRLFDDNNSSSNGYPLAPTKSRNSQRHGLKLEKQQSRAEVVEKEVVEVEGIKERKLSWKQAAALLLTEYVVLAILAFPYSFQVLGYAGATLTTLIIGSSTFYSTHILWRFCAKHPQVRDIADAAQLLSGNRRWAWYLAFVGLALNNYFICGLHSVQTGTAIQTIRNGEGPNTLVWAIIGTIIMYIPSNLRSFNHFTPLGLIASFTMTVAAILVMVGHGVQGNPTGWTEGFEITHSVWAPEGTTFVQGMNAVLNIVYTFIGHALIPSFIGDMEHPEEFPKALGVSMTAQICLYTIVGAVVYTYTGIELTTAPAYGSLRYRFGVVAAGLCMPTILLVGVLYSLVTSRAIFFQIFKEGSVHRNSHTVTGWATWLAIVLGGWIISFIIGEAIPFFSDMLSLIASIFSSWFGYLLWSVAFFQMYRGRYRESWWRQVECVLAVLIGIAGMFFFTVGTYASAQSIKNSYALGAVKAPFTTANTGFVLDH